MMILFSINFGTTRMQMLKVNVEMLMEMVNIDVQIKTLEWKMDDDMLLMREQLIPLQEVQYLSKFVVS